MMFVFFRRDLTRGGALIGFYGKKKKRDVEGELCIFQDFVGGEENLLLFLFSFRCSLFLH